MASLLFCGKKSGHKGEALAPSKTPSTDIIVEPPSNSLPISVTSNGSEVDFRKGPNAIAPNDANILSSDKDGNALTNGLALSEDTENERLQQAATKAQAVFRGYLVIFYNYNVGSPLLCNLFRESSLCHMLPPGKNFRVACVLVVLILHSALYIFQSCHCLCIITGVDWISL